MELQWVEAGSDCWLLQTSADKQLHAVVTFLPAHNRYFIHYATGGEIDQCVLLHEAKAVAVAKVRLT